MKPEPELLSILPSDFSQADAEWIKQQLLSLTPTARQKAIQRYAAVYQETFEAEPVSYRKENRARHEANTRLRLFVRNQGRALQGYTAEPPWLERNRAPHCFGFKGTRTEAGLKAPVQVGNQRTQLLICTRKVVRFYGEEGKGVRGIGCRGRNRVFSNRRDPLVK